MIDIEDLPNGKDRKGGARSLISHHPYAKIGATLFCPEDNSNKLKATTERSHIC